MLLVFLLDAVHPGILTVKGYKLIVGAFFDDHSVFNDQDLLGGSDRA